MVASVTGFVTDPGGEISKSVRIVPVPFVNMLPLKWKYIALSLVLYY